MSNITCFTDEKRHRVYNQSVPVCSGTTRTCVSTCARGCRYTWGRFESTHGGFFSTCQAAPHTTPHKPRSVAILAQVGTVCRGSGLGPFDLSAVFKCTLFTQCCTSARACKSWFRFVSSCALLFCRRNLIVRNSST